MATVIIHHDEVRRIGFKRCFEAVYDACSEVETLAKERSRGPYSTGYLALTTEKRIRLQETLQTVIGTVGSDAYYAKVANDGAKAHPIPIPRRPPGKKMRFYWRKVGSMVAFYNVKHPGMKGKEWLTEPLRVVGRKHNFRVLIYEG